MATVQPVTKAASSSRTTAFILRAICFAAILIGSWVVAFFDPSGLLFLFAVPIVAGRWIVHRRWPTALAYLLLLPTTFTAIQAARDYRAGTARLRYSGLPGTRFFNEDPIYRCGRTTYGCIVSGGEWITQLPYNTTVAALVRCFGYMPGSYDGPYPSEEETKAALAVAKPIDWKALEAGTVSIDDNETRLAEGVGKTLLSRSRYPDDIDREWLWRDGRERPSVKGTVWQERCLLLSIPTELPNKEKESAMLVVIDRRSGRPFAYYEEGEYSHHFPPVEWRPE